MFVKIVKALNGILERMTPRQLLITAAVAGAVMCLLIYVTMKSFEEKLIAEQPEPVELQEVVVATADIFRGTVISADMMKLAPFATKSIPKGSASDIRVFQGLPARVDILRGDIITNMKVYSDIRQAGFIGMIPPDCRAVTIPIDNITGVAGLLNPGDYVDLLLVSGGDSVSSSSGSGVKSEVVLQNVLLLSIDKNINRLSGEIDVNPQREKSTKSEVGESVDEAKKSAEKIADTAETIHKQAGDSLSGENFKGINSGGSMHGLGAAGKGDGGGDTGTATLALKPKDVLKVAAANRSGVLQLALRPFKPAPTAMFLPETEYYTAPPKPERPAPAPQQKPAAPVPQIPSVLPPVPNRPNVNVVPPAKDSDFSYEVIEWGQ